MCSLTCSWHPNAIQGLELDVGKERKWASEDNSQETHICMQLDVKTQKSSLVMLASRTLSWGCSILITPRIAFWTHDRGNLLTEYHEKCDCGALHAPWFAVPVEACADAAGMGDYKETISFSSSEALQIIYTGLSSLIICSPLFFEVYSTDNNRAKQILCSHSRTIFYTSTGGEKV